jgi:hypothetical protein
LVEKQLQEKLEEEQRIEMARKRRQALLEKYRQSPGTQQSPLSEMQSPAPQAQASSTSTHEQVTTPQIHDNNNDNAEQQSTASTSTTVVDGTQVIAQFGTNTSSVTTATPVTAAVHSSTTTVSTSTIATTTTTAAGTTTGTSTDRSIDTASSATAIESKPQLAALSSSIVSAPTRASSATSIISASLDMFADDDDDDDVDIATIISAQDPPSAAQVHFHRHSNCTSRQYQHLKLLTIFAQLLHQDIADDDRDDPDGYISMYCTCLYRILSNRQLIQCCADYLRCTNTRNSGRRADQWSLSSRWYPRKRRVQHRCQSSRYSRQQSGGGCQDITKQ